MDNISEIAFIIISNVGEAKSLAIESINLSKTSQFDEANKKIEDAEQLVIVAEKAHFELIAKEANINY